MKNTVEISLSSIHRGSCREVVTLEIEGKDRADEYLKKLKKKDLKAYRSIITRIKTVAEYETYENDQTFRPVGEGVFEFKRNNPKLIRLYAFYDDIDGIGQLILCTNGGGKGQLQQSEDIQKAKDIKKKYIEAKKKPNAILNYNQPEQ